MMGQHSGSESLFYYFRIEDQVPENHLLRLLDCNVSDGLEAVQKAEELQPDLILLDIGLPSLNGIEVARQIRKLSPKSRFLDDLAQFIGASLRAGNAAIVVSTESHRDSLLPRLQAYGLDVSAAIEQGRYIALDAADALPTLLINGMPDPARFMKVLGDLVATAAKGREGRTRPRGNFRRNVGTR